MLPHLTSVYVCVCLVVCVECVSLAVHPQYSIAANEDAGTRREAPYHSAWALPPCPYGHRIPPLPPQACASVKSNCVECVEIKYPIIQHRHAIKELQPSLEVDIM